MSVLRAVVRSFLRRGFNRVLVPFAPEFHAGARLLRCLESQRVDCVLDVGANTGSYARALLDGGYRGKIISFEPVNALHDDLSRKSSCSPRWEIADRCALGDSPGEVGIHVSENRSSTSILKMNQRHRDLVPKAAPMTVEKVPVRRLDDIGRAFIGDSRRVFLKIDVQGFEEQVLAGASGLMPRIHGLQVEMSFVELYEGQMLFPELLALIERLGFSVWGFDPAFVDPRMGRTLQVDGLFFRSEISA